MAEHDHHDVEVKEGLMISNKVVYQLAKDLLVQLNMIRRNIDLSVSQIKEIEAQPQFEEVLNAYNGADKDDILNNIYALKRVLDTTKDFC